MRLSRNDRRMRFVRQAERSSSDEGLIPLINVIFLILIFFMIAGHLEATDPFRVDPPLSRTDTQPPPGELTLLLAADGRIAAHDQILSKETLEPWLQRWLQSVQSANSGLEPPVVSLKADGNVHSKELRLLLGILRRAGFHNVTLLTDQAR